MTVNEYLTYKGLNINEVDLINTTNGDMVFNVICNGIVHELDVDYTNIIIGSVLNRSSNFYIENDVLYAGSAIMDLNTTNMLDTPTNDLPTIP
jgi:hypothetical protein